MVLSHLESYKLSSLLGHFKNASLLNKKGDLLFSKDADPFKTTTSRIVLFQIVKKYLQFKVGDIFISNDPENGGTSYNRVFFISCLAENLFLIWDSECLLIDFKIPLSPLTESTKINTLLWAALIDSSSFKAEFSAFFNHNIKNYNKLFSFKTYINEISSDSFQKQWFTLAKNLFNKKFDSKSFGESSLMIKYKEQQTIKLNLLIDEKQNIRTVKCDFANTSLVLTGQNQLSTASHVVESGLVIELIKFYNLENFLAQPILDHFKIILPPKSILSNAHKTGNYNFELQKVSRQIMKKNLVTINSIEKKKDGLLNMYSTYLMQIRCQAKTHNIFLSNSRIQFDQLNLFEQKVMQNLDGTYHTELVFKSEQIGNLSVFGIQSEYDHSKRWIKLNNSTAKVGDYTLKNGDTLSFGWKI